MPVRFRFFENRRALNRPGRFPVMVKSKALLGIWDAENGANPSVLERSGWPKTILSGITQPLARFRDRCLIFVAEWSVHWTQRILHNRKSRSATQYLAMYRAPDAKGTWLRL